MIENDPVYYAIPIFLVLVLVELYISYRESLDLFETKDSFASLAMGFGSLFTGGLTKIAAFATYIYLYEHFRIFDIAWSWWAWLLILFADDFTFYWHHRLSHKVRILWASHVNHHSSEHYNLTTALRQSWTEIIYKHVWWIWLPIVGFPPIMIMMMLSINLIYQFFIHTEIVYKFPKPIEFIFNTPSHHRVHHAANPHYIDRNYAGIFIIWDRLFGTFMEEKAKVIYGITNNINTFNPFKIATHEFVNIWRDVKKAKTWKHKLQYLVMPPGWKPKK